MNVIILSESSEKLFEISLTPCSRYVNLKNELFRTRYVVPKLQSEYSLSTVRLAVRAIFDSTQTKNIVTSL